MRREESIVYVPFESRCNCGIVQMHYKRVGRRRSGVAPFNGRRPHGEGAAGGEEKVGHMGRGRRTWGRSVDDAALVTS